MLPYLLVYDELVAADPTAIFDSLPHPMTRISSGARCSLRSFTRVSTSRRAPLLASVWHGDGFFTLALRFLHSTCGPRTADGRTAPGTHPSNCDPSGPVEYAALVGD